MAEKRPICLYGENKEELRAGDTLPGGAGLGTAASANYPITGTTGSPCEVTLGNMPVFSLENGATMGVVGHTGLPDDIDLSTDNPIVHMAFAISATGGGSNVRFSLEMKYIAVGELVTKAPDETLLLTKAVINTINELHTVMFTLDRTKIEATDHIEFHLERLGSAGPDTFTGAVGVMEAITLKYTRK